MWNRRVVLNTEQLDNIHFRYSDAVTNALRVAYSLIDIGGKGDDGTDGISDGDPVLGDVSDMFSLSTPI